MGSQLPRVVLQEFFRCQQAYSLHEAAFYPGDVHRRVGRLVDVVEDVRAPAMYSPVIVSIDTTT